MSELSMGRLVPVLIFASSLLVVGRTSSAETQLYRDLLGSYNRLVRPVRNSSTTLKVEMKLHLQQIMHVDGKNQIIELNAWLRYSWIDYRLMWKPDKYGNISSTRFMGEANQIWLPDILMHNSVNEDFDSTYKSNQVVYNSGEVNWVPPGIFRASCKMDITYFPFDYQTCHLEFGSWSYSGDLVDLRFVNDIMEEAIDLSTYTNNGEWRLISTPAIRRIAISPRTGKPYPKLIFYLHLRRRTIFYLFNVVLPSFLVSIMTLMGFCLPAHDMSEKIGLQTTILLSVCFFVTIVSEMTPPTSECVPILGLFFSTLTLLVSASTAFTITILNIRYRQEVNHSMSGMFYQIFLVWLPWILLMKRPGIAYRTKKAYKLVSDDDDSECEACLNNTAHDLGRFMRPPVQPSSFAFKPLPEFRPAGMCMCASCNAEQNAPIRKGILTPPRYAFEQEEEENAVPPAETIIEKLSKIPEERLHLTRKVGQGIFVPRSQREGQRMSVEERLAKYLNRCLEDAEKLDQCVKDHYLRAVTAYYMHMLENLKALDSKKYENEEQSDLEEWRFAAMVLDRLCLVVFTFLMIVTVISMTYAIPYFDG